VFGYERQRPQQEERAVSDLSTIAHPPSGLEMSAAGQTIFTIAVTIPWVVLFVIALRMWRRDGTAVPLLFMVGGALCILFEPIVDVLGMCFFPRTNQWVGLEVFGRPIPLFMWPVYSWFVGGQAFLFWRAFQRGMTRDRLWRWWLLLMGVNVFLESPGILMDVYRYYGSQPLNPWGLPLWWLACNATMPIVAGYLVYKLSPHLTGARLLLIIPLVPMADGATNGAIAWPVWTALNTQLGFWATYPAAIVTFGLAALVVWVMTRGLPEKGVASPVDPSLGVAQPTLV
jgi:hypothetical protein